MSNLKPLHDMWQGGSTNQNNANNDQQLATINEIVADLSAGKFVILVDDENRENEGDLVCLAEKITPEMVNFIVKEARGMLCLCITQEKADALNLPLQPRRNHHSLYTAFTVSIEAKDGITTGISAHDRWKTIHDAIQIDATENDIATPGHIHPIVAAPNGVLERPGHTEASVDFAKLCDAKPAAIVCEIMNDDGSMSRLPDLLVFAEKHGLKVGKIEDLIEYRKQISCIS